MAPDLVAELSENRRKVDFDTFDITVKELVAMVREGTINIAPEYQRQFRWTDKGQSAFVESVFLGIPIPSLFMAANADGRWEVIDGVQRLSTLVRFVGDDAGRKLIGGRSPLTLAELSKLPSFSGYSFAELPQAVQLQFMLKPLKVTTISDKSDMSVRFDLFERLNTGGVRLEPQEIRSAIFRGPFNEMLKRLARHKDFVGVVRLKSSDEHNATREEMVLRFFAFLSKYRQFEHSVVEFLNGYMAEASKDFAYEAGERLFGDVFGALHRALPLGIVRRSRRPTPMNLFEGVAVGAALAWKLEGKLVTAGIQKWMNSPELELFTTGATNSRKMVAGRVEYCRDRFLGK